MGRWFLGSCLALFGIGLIAPGALAEDDRAANLTARIDRALETLWKSQGARPAPGATDEDFFRRVSLDLTGCIPPSSDVRAFLADTAPDKRRRWVERLLAGPGYVRHQTNVWCELLMPPGNMREVPRWRLDLETWLSDRLRQDVPYDRLVRELITTSVTITQELPNGRPDRPHEPTPLTFYRVNEFKADNLAAQTARVFLGVNLECAQCHDHPFAPWKKRDFAAFAAFFAGVEPTRYQSGRVIAATERFDRRTFALPDSAAVAARFLDRTEPRWPEKESGRAVLAEWITDSRNPFFPQHAVSRLWEHFFGAPLIEEADSPFKELLEVMSEAFVAEKYDVKLMIRAVLASRAYQMTSETTANEGNERTRLFARMRVRGLSAEQLYDSVVRAAGLTEAAALRADFLGRFKQTGEKTADRQTSILQTLTLLNGPLLATATDPDRGRFLAGLAEAPWLDDAGRVDALHLATYSRLPRAEERSRWVESLHSGEKSSDRQRALADMLWVLLNSSEFLFNR